MNCQECRDDFAACQEGLLEPEAESRTTAHLAECPACRAEFDEVQRLVVRLTRAGPGASGISLENRVMDRIIHQQALTIRRLQMRKRIRLLGIGGVLTAALVLLIIAGVQMAQPDNRVLAAEALAQGANAVPNITSIHIQGKMRTPSGDNFSNINNPSGDLVPIELWKQFGEKSKWRVEKPGRVVVMDGDSTIMLIKPNTGVKIPQPTNSAFDTHWLLSLTNVHDLTKEELQSALAKGWDMKLAHEQDNGAEKLVVTVEAKAGLSDDNYMKNKFIDTSDTRRVYRFDAKTKQLEAIHIYLHEKDKDALIFEANNIDYNKPIDPAIFSLDLPKNVVWDEEPGKLPDNEKYEKMTPKEAAAGFFEACSKENWDDVQKIWGIPANNTIKEYLGGLQVISIGEPFQAKPYPGWFVPYEIKFKNGEVKKFRLAVRNDNPGKRYVVDGGI
ncbi:MAG: hypothetical protein ABSE63_05785 [Thermoguttaceae bacterium]|jgi:anti-sigma factor ChrR (cupin superfamily)